MTVPSGRRTESPLHFSVNSIVPSSRKAMSQGFSSPDRTEVWVSFGASAAAVAGTRPGKAGDGGRPGLDEGERLKALAEQTGAPLRSVKALAGQAGKAGAGLEAVRLACVYVARGGGGQNILETAQALAEDSKVNQLVMSRLQIDRRARRLIDGMEDEGRKAFASTVFFGGGGGT